MASRCRCFISLLVTVVLPICLPITAYSAKLYVVYASIGGTQSIGWIAKEAGLFAKHGLDVAVIPLDRTGDIRRGDTHVQFP